MDRSTAAAPQQKTKPNIKNKTEMSQQFFFARYFFLPLSFTVENPALLFSITITSDLTFVVSVTGTGCGVPFDAGLFGVTHLDVVVGVTFDVDAGF
jgi:hypothetical protein